MQEGSKLMAIPDDVLLRRLSSLVRDSRRVEADLVAHIGEVDARKLYAREAMPSMFAHCTRVLHLSEAETWLRILVARASREHPMLLPMLRDGRLHLSGIRRLAPHLTPTNRETLLKLATHKTRRQIEELVSSVAPRPDAPTVMRKLPARRENTRRSVGQELGPDPVGSSMPEVAVGGVEAADLNPLTPGSTGESPELKQARRPAICALGPDPAAAPPDPARPRPATVEPLAPARYKFQFTAGVGLRDKLERLQALMRVTVPDGDLPTIIELAVTEKLERLEARRFAKTKAPRKSIAQTDTRPTSRHVPAAVRRAVYARDEGRCTFVDDRGKRCRTRDRLEFHHHHQPFGRGGNHSAGNIRMMCRVHNQLQAERDFGKEKMGRYRRRKRVEGHGSERAGVCGGSDVGVSGASAAPP
jgi:hypothetical protein